MSEQTPEIVVNGVTVGYGLEGMAAAFAVLVGPPTIVVLDGEDEEDEDA